MRPVLNVVARHVVALLLALALTVIVGMFIGVRGSGDPRFVDMAFAFAVVCLVGINLPWLLGRRRA